MVSCDQKIWEFILGLGPEATACDRNLFSPAVSVLLAYRWHSVCWTSHQLWSTYVTRSFQTIKLRPSRGQHQRWMLPLVARGLSRLMHWEFQTGSSRTIRCSFLLRSTQPACRLIELASIWNKLYYLFFYFFSFCFSLHVFVFDFVFLSLIWERHFTLL